ncbi:MAG: cobalamin B12-binding domain-containing protein [Acidimicrobiales bacterium]
MSTAGSRSDGADGGTIRVILAKLGLDGHDRGLKVVARILRDAGFEVIYLGLRQTTDSIVEAAEQEDADAIGLSMHNAGHMTLAPMMVKALAEAELDIPVVVGGIVPDRDLQPLLDQGVSVVLGPGASAEEVAQAVREAVTANVA